MSFKVKELAMSVGGLNINEASTCSTWTRQQTGVGGSFCTISAVPVAGPGARNLSALRAQLRQAVAQA